MCDISVVFPVYNKQNSIPEVYRQVSAAIRDGIGTEDYELVFVDDASTDESLLLLQQISETDGHVRVVRMPVNSGQLKALETGIHCSFPRVMIFASCDLQNPVDVIPELYRAVTVENHDLAVPYRAYRIEAGFSPLLSEFFFAAVRLLFPKIPPGGFDYAAFGEELQRHLRLLRFDKVVIQMELLKHARSVHYVPITRTGDELDKSSWSLAGKLRYALRFMNYLSMANPVRLMIAILTLILIALGIWLSWA